MGGGGAKPCLWRSACDYWVHEHRINNSKWLCNVGWCLKESKGLNERDKGGNQR